MRSSSGAIARDLVDVDGARLLDLSGDLDLPGPRLEVVDVLVDGPRTARQELVEVVRLGRDVLRGERPSGGVGVVARGRIELRSTRRTPASGPTRRSAGTGRTRSPCAPPRAWPPRRRRRPRGPGRAPARTPRAKPSGRRSRGPSGSRAARSSSLPRARAAVRDGGGTRGTGAGSGTREPPGAAAWYDPTGRRGGWDPRGREPSSIAARGGGGSRWRRRALGTGPCPLA